MTHDDERGMDDGERWLPVVGWETYYEVSDRGRVRRVGPATGTRPGKILKSSCDAWGYRRVTLSRKSQRKYEKVHRLVLSAFVGPCPPGMEGRHLDGDPANPRLVNLAWGTPAENSRDKDRHGSIRRGERHPAHRLTAATVATIRRSALDVAELAAQHGISPSTVRDVIQHRTWRCAP